MGDFRAQIAAVKTGERRFLEMLQKYGRDAVVGGIAAIMDHSEALTRARVREIPDGVYVAELFMDDDGVNVGQRVPIKVKVEVSGDRMKVDLTDVSKQVQGFYNSGETAGRSVLPGRVQMPHVRARPADQRRPVPRARHRAAARPRGQRRQTGRDADVDDLSDDRHRHDLQGAVARDPRRGDCRPSRRPGGGPGQRPASEGRQLLHLPRRADRRRLGRQVQQRRPQLDHRDERRRHPQRPVRTGRGEISAAGRAVCAAAGFRRRGALPRRARLRAGGAGAAHHPVQFADGPGEVQTVGGWTAGSSGLGNGVAISRFGKAEEQRFHNGKALNQVLHAGDAYILRSGGGGGFGSPLDRDLAASSATCAAAMSPGERRRKTTARCSWRLASSMWRRRTRGAPRCARRACRTTSQSPTPACRRPRRASASPRPRAREAHRGRARRAGDDRPLLLVNLARAVIRAASTDCSVPRLRGRVREGHTKIRASSPPPHPSPA